MTLPGIGTFVNALTIGLGSGLGWIVGQRFPARFSGIVLQAMGLLVVVIGIQMALTAQTAAQSMIVLVALVSGSVLGEWINLEARLQQVGQRLEAWVTRYLGPSPVTKAFTTASIIYVVGPLAILGSLQDGIQRDPSLLLIKSALDGLASIAFTASMGIGVIFSIAPVVIYQGSITLLSQQISGDISTEMIEALTATGGILVMGVGTNLLNLFPLRLANMLPALLIVSVIVGFVPLWNWQL